MVAQHYRPAAKTPAEVFQIIEARRGSNSPLDDELKIQAMPQVTDQANLKVRVYDHLFEPPQNGWSLPDRSRIADYSIVPHAKWGKSISLENIVEFLIEQRGIAPSAVGQIIEVVFAYQPALETNLSGMLTMCGSFRSEDCAHEFFGRGIDCTRYE